MNFYIENLQSEGKWVLLWTKENLTISVSIKWHVSAEERSNNVLKTCQMY